MTNKYRAKSFYLDLEKNQVISTIEAKRLTQSVKDNLIYFASKHEYNVYYQLQRLSGNYTVELQPKVPIIPTNTISCYPKGKYWKADFIVNHFGEPTMLIEAKGKLTRDFMLTLALLELNNRSLFDKLWLIFPSRIPQNLIIKRLNNTPMKKRILTLQELPKQLQSMNML